MRLHFKYVNYPKSEKLTEKSKRVGTLTHPLYGIILGGLIGIAAMSAFPKSVTIPMILMLAGVVGCPILLLLIRKKKFAKYDAEYKKLLKRMSDE
ncbi:MAG: hypothetical protein IKJ65_11830 [Clostridia bacterium]|nr:hypothetical protein [Clostridia bacterium]